MLVLLSFCTDAMIDSVHVRETLVDTKSAFSMLSIYLCKKHLSQPPVLLLGNFSPDIVGVGGASSEIKGYIDVPLQLAGEEVAHLLLLVSNVPYLILVCTDILQSHQATVSFGAGCSPQLRANFCSVCLKSRVDPDRQPRSAPAAVIPRASKTLTAVHNQATS